jgi:hypothetical protein
MEDISFLRACLDTINQENQNQSEKDREYVKSFDIDMIVTDAAYYRQAKSFFEQYGFVVISNVYSEQECKSSIESMWDIVEGASENKGLLRDDPRSWANYQAAGNYGLSMRGPCFHPCIVNNRQSKKLSFALSMVLETTVDDLIVSHDRFTIYRATCPEITLEDGRVDLFDGNSFRTGPRNLHLGPCPSLVHVAP